MKDGEDMLACLLELNLALVAKEAKGQSTTPPDLPAFVLKASALATDDCVQSPAPTSIT
jgi:hypothetical protein